MCGKKQPTARSASALLSRELRTTIAPIDVAYLNCAIGVVASRKDTAVTRVPTWIVCGVEYQYLAQLRR